MSEIDRLFNMIKDIRDILELQKSIISGIMLRLTLLEKEIEQ